MPTPTKRCFAARFSRGIVERNLRGFHGIELLQASERRGGGVRDLMMVPIRSTHVQGLPARISSGGRAAQGQELLLRFDQRSAHYEIRGGRKTRPRASLWRRPAWHGTLLEENDSGGLMRPSLLTYTAPGAGRRVALGTFSTTFKVLSEASRGSVALVEHAGPRIARRSAASPFAGGRDFLRAGRRTSPCSRNQDRAGRSRRLHSQAQGSLPRLLELGQRTGRFLEVIAPGGFEHF